MAYWIKKGKGVYVYTRSTPYSTSGEPKPLPRKETKHLDIQTNQQIDAWVRQFEIQYEGKIHKDSILWSDSELSKYLNQYTAYLLSRGKDSETVKQHERYLRRNAIPFFLSFNPPQKDPITWHTVSPKMLNWLLERGETDSVIFRTNVALRGFYNYLQEESILPNHIILKLRNPVSEQTETPLKKIIEPDEMLRFANTCLTIEIKLIALIGYFFSLRPQELFALQKSDFMAGSKASFLECSKAMTRHSLFNRFVVNIDRQRANTGRITDPKAYSKGWVSCFDKRAAQAITSILNEHYTGDSQLFTIQNRELYKRWAENGFPDLTIKDMRRSSLYYLGHHTGFNQTPIDLMKHARHKDIETTMLYLRRPRESVDGDNDILDLDA
ncbi:MAG: hypothetical protein ACOH5I_15855 [Oligoflexus sp.]